MKANFLSPDSPDADAVLRKEGVVLFDALLDPEQVASTREALDRYEREVLDTVPAAHVDRYDDGTLRSLLDLHRYDSWFRTVAQDPRLMDLVRRAVPWEPVLYYVETFPKPPGAGALPAHQEIFTVPVDPPDFVHLWIPLVDVTSANGGMAFYRRSHRLGIAPHVQQSRYFGVEQTLLDKMAPLRIEPDFPAGSGALFDCHTIHVSGANGSDSPRPVLVIGFRGAHTLVKSDEEVLANCVLRICREELGASYGLDDDLPVKEEAVGVGRVLERIRKDYAVEVPPAALDRLRTPAALAAHIDAASADGHRKGAEPR
ncbi:phytanoyl-CoA dioxygenase family protein [Streptomyces sp. NPDC002561]|uniref:phytanoyl-CoA dioxygenase family protein n=1 Tax=unclassified Streptomyces TaxID=2593676 RepID=UPI0011E7A906|nr:phytanoyl-CoA dioxygenase family protein [Streptomyces sp. sk2.1]TXS71341.1 hypothetical protein EAO76_21680 [Streptomyces sp. sk2.1]